MAERVRVLKRKHEMCLQAPKQLSTYHSRTYYTNDPDHWLLVTTLFAMSLCSSSHSEMKPVSHLSSRAALVLCLVNRTWWIDGDPVPGLGLKKPYGHLLSLGLPPRLNQAAGACEGHTGGDHPPIFPAMSDEAIRDSSWPVVNHRHMCEYNHSQLSSSWVSSYTQSMGRLLRNNKCLLF